MTTPVFAKPNTAVPTLMLSHEAHQRIMAYTRAVDTEISGFADCVYNEEANMFFVNTVYLLKQQAGGADVEIDDDSLAELMEELIEQGVTQMPQLWWHSHATMSTFFSGTDESTMCDLKNDSYMVSLVVNKAGSMKAVLNLWKPVALTLDMAVDVEEQTEDIPEDIRLEVEEKVSRRIYVPAKPAQYLTSGTSEDGPRHKPGITKIRQLPKDAKKAQGLIDKLQLVKTYDWHSGQHYWHDLNTNTDYFDFWGVMPENNTPTLASGDIDDEFSMWRGED